MNIDQNEIRALVQSYLESTKDGAQILRRRDVLRLTSFCTSTLYVRMSEGLWTHGIVLGGQAVGWPAFECKALVAALMASRSNEYIKVLVLALEGAREEVFKSMLSKVA